MRIDNKTLETLGTTTGASATQRAGAQSSSLSTQAASGQRADQATLSNATNLVSLAKNATSTARQAKISALTAQVSSGSYQGNTAQAGQAMVQELLQSTTSAAHR
jgi:anti-sigma28 factor (negative regulator of flagellin synthesis)